MITLVNPYCTRAEVQAELKNADTAQAVLDDIDSAINGAARWIDNYLHRTFYTLDYRTTAKTYHQHSREVIGDMVVLPGPVTSLSEVKLGADVLVENTDFVTINPDSWGMGGARLIRIQPLYQPGRSLIDQPCDLSWNPSLPDYPLAIKGIFGFGQPFGLTAATMTNGGTGYVANNILTVFGGTGTSATVKVLTVNGSGVIQTFSILTAGAYTVPPVTSAFTGGSGTTVAFTLTFTLDTSAVPLNLPGHINLAAKQVAAALTGHNRKDSVGLDGSKVTLNDRAIPKTVFDMLGKRSPILV